MIALRVRSISPAQAIALIAILSLSVVFGIMSMPACGCGKPSPKVQAQASMQMLNIALNAYRTQRGEYPAIEPGGNGSELLWRSLCGTTPYIDPNPKQIAKGHRSIKIVSPLGGDYSYAALKNAEGKITGFILIDPGADKELGGRLDPEKGFIIEDAKKAADNLVVEERG